MLRRDIVEKLKPLRPGFIRTPGGSYMANYRWQQTVGVAAARPGHYSPWGYWVTDGLGFFELLRFAEVMESKIMMAVQDGQHDGPGNNGCAVFHSFVCVCVRVCMLCI